MILILLAGLSLMMAADETGSRVIFYIIACLSVILMLIMTFSTVTIVLSAWISSIRLMKKEGVRVSNCLSALFGCMIVGQIILNGMILNIELPDFFYYSFLIANTILIYLIFIFAVFFISSLIYQFHIPIRPVAYIIVLGSGLIDGIKVPPLLAGRIDRALKVYRKQAKHPPILVMSGGQGGDEKVPESHAMRDYALACGINADHIIVENQSKNTYENLLFSKRVIEEREKDTRRLRILFSTTNYHVYRAGIYASKVKLKANGIGAPTRFYFWLNALVREYVAILVMNKKKHVICLGMLLILAIVCGIIMREEQNVLNLIRMIYQYVQ